jgi:hypothetical protein
LFLEGIGRLKNRLGGDQAAVAAATVDITHVEFALERARAGGAKDYLEYPIFRPFLPPENRQEADALVDGSFALATAFDMRYPLATDFPVTSPFGERTHPVLLTRRMHTGVDYGAPTGTQIVAVADGSVVYATKDAVNGWFVKLDHGHGLTSAYCHASSLAVARGDQAPRGSLLALSGATGRATGPHLHFQLELNGRPIDPELFIKASHRAQVGAHRRSFTGAEEHVANDGAGEERRDGRVAREAGVELKDDAVRGSARREVLRQDEALRARGRRGQRSDDLAVLGKRFDDDGVGGDGVASNGRARRTVHSP